MMGNSLDEPKKRLTYEDKLLAERAEMRAEEAAEAAAAASVAAATVASSGKQ